jgi:hypothetical protein
MMASIYYHAYRLKPICLDSSNTVPSAEEKAPPVTACALHALPPPGVTVTLDLHSLLKPVTIAMLF